MKKRILNLYAGIGGNRLLWDSNKYEIVSVEKEDYVANAYSQLNPNDKIIIADAHEFLLKEHSNFDFIWSSPPCPTHSRASTSLYGHGVVRYPDMTLYQEIIFLQKFFKGKFVVENVIPYYKPLINPTIEIDRHLFWSNFSIAKIKIPRNYNVNRATKEVLSQHLNIVLPKSMKGKRKALRNAVHPKVGLHILENAFLTQGILF